MNFDKPNGAGLVTVSAALYGTVDTGVTFTAVVRTPASRSTRQAAASYTGAPSQMFSQGICSA